MTVYDLNRDQIMQLKQTYLFEKMDEEGLSPSWGELADCDELVSDDTIYDYYGDIDFVEDDFWT